MNDPVSAVTKDGRYGYEAAGDPSLPPLVFLHGVGGAARAWRDQLRVFGHSYRAIAWDMPGYGASAPFKSVSITTLAEAFAEFLQALEITKPALVGHSVGGMVVQQALAKNPTIAGAIVLAQTSPAFGRPDGEWQKAFIDTRLGPLDRGETLASLADGLVTELVGDDPDPAGMALARDCMASVPEPTYRATMRALIGFDLRERLPEIGAPTMILSGSKDQNAPAPMMAKMAARIPGATYVELPGCGHLANLEQPANFNRALEEFLRHHFPHAGEQNS